MTQFVAVRQATGEIEYGVGRSDKADFAGPIVAPPSEDGFDLFAWQGVIPFGKAPTTTCKLRWDGAKPSWLETASIEEQRLSKGEEINAAWIKADASAFMYDGNQFRAGHDDIVRLNSINGYISLFNEMPPDWVGVWKTMDNTFIAMPDIAAWKPFYCAFVMKGVTNYMVAQSLKASIASAMTAEEIAAIHWPE